MELSELLDLTAKQLDDKFLFKPDRKYIEARLVGHNIKSGQLKRDPNDPKKLLKALDFKKFP